MAASSAIPLLNLERHDVQESSQKPSLERYDDFGNPIDGADGRRKRSKKRVTQVLQNIKSRKKAFVSALIHIPPIGITVFILSFTFRSVFWTGPTETMNTILNVLQFAAQAHGTLIIASLSAMLLHLVHLELASERGIPLGFVSSSFQLNSIAYLFRHEFTSLRLKYILVFVCAFTLAILSNPSSAIVTLPRLQYWPVRNYWLGKGNMGFRVFMATPADELYPSELQEKHLPPNCLQPNASIQTICPSYGMRHWMMTSELFTFNAEGGAAPRVNKTIQGNWLRYMNARASTFFQGIQSEHMASTLSNFLGNILFAFDDALGTFGQRKQGILGIDGPSTLQYEVDSNLGLRYDLAFQSAKKDVPTRKPVVSVECGGFPVGTQDLYLLHDRMVLPPWNTDPIYSARWKLDVSEFSELIGSSNSSIVNSSIIDIDRFGDTKPSLGVFFATPELHTLSSGYCNEDCGDVSLNRNHSMFTCTIDARWLPTRAFSDSSYGARAIFDFDPDPLDDATSEHGEKKGSPSVYLSSSWTKALDVPWIDNILYPTPSNRSMIDIIGQRCLDANTQINATLFGRRFEDGLPHRVIRDPMAMLQCLQIGLSIAITEALARVQDSIPTYFVVEGHDIPVDRPTSYSSDVFLVTDLFSEMPFWGEKFNYANDGWIRNFTKADFEDPARFTEVYMSTGRWGYGYGFHDSILIYVGAVILLIHVALGVAYIIWIMWEGEYKDAGWETIGGLVHMAMKSGTEEEKMDDENDEEIEGRKSKKERRMAKKRKWTTKVAVRVLKEDGYISGGVVRRGKKGTLVLRRISEREGKEEDVESTESLVDVLDEQSEQHEQGAQH